MFSPLIPPLAAYHTGNLYLTVPLFSAGELTTEELERIVTIIQNPTQYKIPTWFLNRQRDIVDGKDSQILANALDNKLREDLERLKKVRAHRGLRHYWGLRVRGQHTKTTGEFSSSENPVRLCADLLMVFVYRSSRPDRRCVEEEGLNVSLFFLTVGVAWETISSALLGGIVEIKKINVYTNQRSCRTL